MVSKMNKMKTQVFSPKLKLSNIVCALLIVSVTMIATLTLLMYHYVVYLRISPPIWIIILTILITPILAHFSLVALKGLAKGVRSN